MNTITIIDLPRAFWRVEPPSKIQVVFAVVGIVVSAIAWGMFG